MNRFHIEPVKKGNNSLSPISHFRTVNDDNGRFVMYDDVKEMIEELDELRKMVDWMEKNSNQSLCDYENR